MQIAHHKSQFCRFLSKRESIILYEELLNSQILRIKEVSKVFFLHLLRNILQSQVVKSQYRGGKPSRRCELFRKQIQNFGCYLVSAIGLIKYRSIFRAFATVKRSSSDNSSTSKFLKRATLYFTKISK